MFSKNNTDRYTPDFNTMIKIAILNSLGFFLPYCSSFVIASRC